MLGLVFFILLAPAVFADNTTYSCINGNLLQVNTSLVINENGALNNISISENYYCPKGCVDGSMSCTGQAGDTNFGLTILVALIASAFILFYISFSMAEEHIYVRWLFFFLGYLTLIGVLLAGVTIAWDMGKDSLAGQLEVLAYVFGVFFFVLFIYILLKMTKNLFHSMKVKKEEKLLGPN